MPTTAQDLLQGKLAALRDEQARRRREAEERRAAAYRDRARQLRLDATRVTTTRIPDYLFNALHMEVLLDDDARSWYLRFTYLTKDPWRLNYRPGRTDDFDLFELHRPIPGTGMEIIAPMNLEDKLLNYLLAYEEIIGYALDHTALPDASA